jgi:5,6-dimethylbenzimidazole synthase
MNHRAVRPIIRGVVIQPKLSAVPERASVMVPRTGLRLTRWVRFEAWLEIGSQLMALASSAAWCLGDWLIFGQKMYKGRYREAVAQTGLDYQTLRNYAWVARRFELPRRRDSLSFGHHAEVASLPEHEQDFWLRKAEKFRWSTSQLRHQVRISLRERRKGVPAVELSRLEGSKKPEPLNSREMSQAGLDESPESPPAASEFYDVIHRRRDVHGQFTGAAVAAEVLNRILAAAHAAPSVGLRQPWDFIVVRDRVTRQAFHEHVQQERDVYAATLIGEAARRFAQIKIDRVLESTLSVVVTYDVSRGRSQVLGRHTVPDTGLYSVCLAIQNLWLAATAEGFGVGWVSFYREEFVRQLLGIPADIRPVAWLCLGPVTHLEAVPDRERRSWRQRRPLQAAVHTEHW